MRTESPGNLPSLFLVSALALPAVYSLSLLTNHDGSCTVTDLCCFMVVHLWAEVFLELFTTVMVAADR